MFSRYLKEQLNNNTELACTGNWDQKQLIIDRIVNNKKKPL